MDKQNKIREKLFALRQTTSVQNYTTLFRQYQCELTSKVDDETLQFLYLHGLKEAVRLQVNVARPNSLEDIILIAERVDQAIMSS